MCECVCLNGGRQDGMGQRRLNECVECEEREAAKCECGDNEGANDGDSEDVRATGQVESRIKL